MVFFHFGRSKDLGGNDYFIYIGSKTKACLSNGLLRRLPHKQIDTINSQRVQWFAFNQDYEWFSAFNKSGGYLGGSSAGEYIDPD
ncbi:uncharacterized protein HMPREF1541_05246 [Cyphellophora europaea CBS 101466]|uniref:Uncharacterized protein n=1 Tax=Cyphellophora europaea (strain CBS 101466) TaxID=1220924 RepID=W2RWU8_CYPE1|nr:uncharacterized protein HMPREF1541_05246 [Cyphellophora europaea CBS 101466]ETN40966.1 hypothetical protein HMPREF1541_05246 [Cyphellophora europaea CBS 101466]